MAQANTSGKLFCLYLTRFLIFAAAILLGPFAIMIGVGIFFCIKAKEFMEDEHCENEWLKNCFCFII
jgi:hypothetical protein